MHIFFTGNQNFFDCHQIYTYFTAQGQFIQNPISKNDGFFASIRALR